MQLFFAVFFILLLTTVLYRNRHIFYQYKCKELLKNGGSNRSCFTWPHRMTALPTRKLSDVCWGYVFCGCGRKAPSWTEGPPLKMPLTAALIIEDPSKHVAGCVNARACFKTPRIKVDDRFTRQWKAKGLSQIKFSCVYSIVCIIFKVFFIDLNWIQIMFIFFKCVFFYLWRL